MMEIGFTLWQCMNEKLENSDSANAGNIKITLHDKKLVIADDGHGMNEEEMKTCGKFHNRSSSSADKHGTKGVGGNIADINLSGGGRVIYCSKSASSTAEGSQSITYMELNYGVQTEEEYRPRPQEAPRSKEEQIWNRYAIDPSRTGTVQVIENVPSKIYKDLLESIKANDIVHSFRRIWAFTYESILRSGKTIIFDVEGDEFTLHPIDMMKYDETEHQHRQKDVCSIYVKNGSSGDGGDELRVYYTNPTNSKLYYRDYSRSNRGNETEQKRRPEEDGYTKIGDFTITHTYNQNWRELHKAEMERNGIDVACCNDQDFLNHSGGGVLTIARNRKHVCQFPTCQTGESASYIPYHQNSKHLLDYDASDAMDELFNIQLNKSSLVRDNIQKDVFRTVHYLNRKFIGKMKTLTEKQEQEAAAMWAAASEEQHNQEQSSASSASSLSGSEEEYTSQQHDELSSSVSEEQQHVFEPPIAPDNAIRCGGGGSSGGGCGVAHMVTTTSRVIHIPEHTRETIPQNHGIQILQTLKQQPQYHDAMGDTVDTLLADGCCRISDERIRRMMTKRIINIGSFENKCDMLCELLQGIYVLPEDTMRHGAELYRKYNAVATVANDSVQYQ